MMAVPQLRPRPQPSPRHETGGAAEADHAEEVVRPRRRIPRVERFLLVIAVISIPFENRVTAPMPIPLLGAPSVTWLAFAALGAFIVVRSPSALARVARHPAVVPVYVFLVVAVLMEITHVGPSFEYWWRTVQMVIGALFVAAACRDRDTVRAASVALVLVGLGLALLLVATTYSPLRHTRANTFTEVSAIRNDLLSQSFKSAEINSSAFLIAEAAAVAFALGLTGRSRRERNLYVATGLICFFAVFLSLSRGGVAVVLAAVILVLLKVSRNKPVVAFRIFAVAIIAAVVIPHSVYARLQLTPDLKGHKDPRIQVYDSALKYLPEYVTFGVGAGGFAAQWGVDHGFVKHGNVLNTHNTFVQVAIYWGLPGLLALLYVVFAMWRALPPGRADLVTSVVLKALALALLVLMLSSHTIYGKEVSLTIGLVLGSRVWRIGHPDRTAGSVAAPAAGVAARTVVAAPA